ncbi:MAG: glyceraldehyde-3-phosphate dehydrogenase [Bacteroidetes bacterium]|nr:glyceraldehyde-3-phosphate dehydrogenase [Bacteroidota bacterium]
MSKVRVGLMGFGEVSRHIYRLCLEDDQIEIVAIAEIGTPDILHYLLVAETKGGIKVDLDGHFLVSKNGRARMIHGKSLEPGEVPWDMFDVDVVVDGTGKYKSRHDMEKHLKAGAGHVVLSTLPTDPIDRIVVMGVNDQTINISDKLVSAGSATTNAAAIMLKIINETFGVDYAMLTTVHSYTSDQPLRDKASTDYRRSRSAAENIIPNETPSPAWIQEIMPEFRGRIEGTALNVPVPNGSLLDLTTVLKTGDIDIDKLNKAVEEAAKKYPSIIQVVEDPIVSTDVIGNRHSVVFDKIATMKTKGRMLKTLVWYHTALAQASRIKDVILAYHKLQEKGGVL